MTNYQTGDLNNFTGYWDIVSRPIHEGDLVRFVIDLPENDFVFQITRQGHVFYLSQVQGKPLVNSCVPLSEIKYPLEIIKDNSI